jgi:hypothetical protein
MVHHHTDVSPALVETLGRWKANKANRLRG